MVNFDEYIAQMEERRAREKRATFNAVIARRLKEKTHEQAVADLYANLTFIGGVSDILLPASSEKRLQLVF